MKKIFTLALAALLIVPMAASAHGPSRQKVVEKIVINATPEKVWEMVGDFGGLHNWHPAVAATTMEGEKTRILSLGDKDGPTITEDLKALDNEKMMMKYRITDMTVVGEETHLGKTYEVPVVPVHNYLAVIKVQAVEGGTEVTWTGKFYRVFQLNYERTEPKHPKGLGDADGVNAITGIFKAGLENLKKLCEEEEDYC